MTELRKRKTSSLNQLAGIKIPAETKVSARGTTIRGAFVTAIIPVIPWTYAQVAEWEVRLRIDKNNVTCKYCGDKASELDHFFAVVKDKKPTGYVTDIYNLIPSCGKCNQSKGGKYWKDWMAGDAPNSPHTRNIADFGPRLETLDNYENWIANKVTIIPFSKFESDSLYTTYFEECESLIKTLETYQSKAVTLKNYIEKRISAEQANPQQISQQSTIVP